MSNKITKTVTYEINYDGDCRKCKSRRGLYQCIAFDINVKWTGSEYVNCQACKDYLAEIKSKVYCEGCAHRRLSSRYNNFKGCDLENPQSVDPVGRYSVNCKNRSSK